MNQKELKELIEFLIEKDISEFELERGDVKVRIRRGTAAAGLRCGRAFLHSASGGRLRLRNSAFRRLPPVRPLVLLRLWWRLPRPKKGCTLCAPPSWALSTNLLRQDPLLL